jgi:hypothetical protein
MGLIPEGALIRKVPNLVPLTRHGVRASAIAAVQVGAEKPAGASAGRELVIVSPNSSIPYVTLNGGAEL